MYIIGLYTNIHASIMPIRIGVSSKSIGHEAIYEYLQQIDKDLACMHARYRPIYFTETCGSS